MSVNKKYFYLKLKDNFFETDEMIILESMQDGYKYSNILLKLYLRSLKNEGKLMVNDRIPFNSTMLASVTRHSVGDIEKAVAIFKDLGLIEVLDNGAIYMSDIQNFIGHLSSEGERKKEYRLKISKESGTMSQKCLDICPPEIELEKELDIELDNTACNNVLETPKKPKLSTNVKRTISQLSAEETTDLQNKIDTFILDLEAKAEKHGISIPKCTMDFEDFVLKCKSMGYKYVDFFATYQTWHRSNVAKLSGAKSA